MEKNNKENDKVNEEENDDEQQNANEQQEKVTEESASEEEEKYMDFYIRLRRKIDNQIKDRNEDTPINTMINLLTVLPDLLHLNIKLLFDGKMKAEKKGAILGAILYVISPIDLIPDILPAFGWLDDLIVITLGLNSLLDDKKDDYVKVAVKKYWAGEMPIFELTHHIIDIVNHTVEFLPRRIMKIVKDLLRGK